jgi:hypothetical protein
LEYMPTPPVLANPLWPPGIVGCWCDSSADSRRSAGAAGSGTAGRLGQCLSGVMMKSLAIAAAAALSGPAIGVVVFFAANGEHSKGEATTHTGAPPCRTKDRPSRDSQNICASRAVARPYLNLGSGLQTTNFDRRDTSRATGVAHRCHLSRRATSTQEWALLGTQECAGTVNRY